MGSRIGKATGNGAGETQLHESLRQKAATAADDFEHFVEYLLRDELPPELKIELERRGDPESYSSRNSFEIWKIDNLEAIEHVLRAIDMFRRWAAELADGDLADLTKTCRDLEDDFANALLSSNH